MGEKAGKGLGAAVGGQDPGVGVMTTGRRSLIRRCILALGQCWDPQREVAVNVTE